ncbi:MAG: 50S ribosomal protein L4, partial [Phycisphaeraceae bacterium]|nr:50S ribosomal protein L4 [Phycisphaeraceae bacterium]
MIEIPVHNQDGKQVSTLKVDEQLLGGEVRHALLKQAYVAMHANRRLGTSVTKNRSMVEGSTRKLYKQKGTGNARRGAVRTNIMKG